MDWRIVAMERMSVIPGHGAGDVFAHGLHGQLVVAHGHYV